MDPNACIDRIHDAVTDDPGDAEEALSAVLDLREWLARGGFAPDAEHVDKLAVVIEKLVEDFWL